MAGASLVTALLIRWANGYVEIEDTDGIVEYGRIVGFVKLGDVQSAEQATVMGEKLLAKRAAPLAAVEADIEPDDDSIPFDDFEVGDTIDCPDEDLTAQPTRVISIGFTEDDVGEPIYSVGLASRQIDTVERHEAWLKAMSRGTLDGTVLAAAPAPVPTEPLNAAAEGTGGDNEVLFSMGGDIREVISPRYYEHVESSTFGPWQASLDTAGTTDTTLDLVVNGTVHDSFVIPDGDNAASGVINPLLTLGVGDYMQIEVAIRGAGTRDLTVQLYRQ